MRLFSWNTSQVNKDTKQILRLVDKLLIQNANYVPELASSASDMPPKVVGSGSTLERESLVPSKLGESLAYDTNEALEPSKDTTILQCHEILLMAGNTAASPYKPAGGDGTGRSTMKSCPDIQEKSLEGPITPVKGLADLNERVKEMSIESEAIGGREEAIEGDQIPEEVHIGQQLSADDEASVEINEEDASTETSEAVKIAVETGNLEMVLLLFDFAGKVNVDDFNYAAALESAVTNGHGVAVHNLLEHGVNVNAKGPNYGSPLLAAIHHRKVDMADILISHGADIQKEDVLTQAVQSRTPQMVELLVKAGVDVETKGPWGNNQLIIAVQYDNMESLKVLLNHGADVNGTGYYGTTALTIAIAQRKIPMIKLLLSRGAKASIDNAFVKAAQSDNGHELLKILIVAGVEGVSSQSCVASAAAAGNSRSSKMLVEAGADIEAKGAWSNSPIIYAVRSGKLDVLKTMLDLGADINATGEYGVTALTSAIGKDNTEMVQYLVSRGADATIDDAVAKAAGRPAGHGYLKILRDGGADGFLS